MASSQGRVLVTGGAGFIGSELVRQLADCCEDVVVVDNLVNGKRENLTDALSDTVRLVEADIRDTDKMAELVGGIDVVYHLACLGVRHSIHSPRENHEVNATATLELLRLARAADVERFVCVSSSEVYGTGLWAPMGEQHPTFPMTVYGGAKLAGECYARAYYRTYEYPTVVVRPFNTYGPRSHHEGDSGEVIPKFLLRCQAGQPMVIFGDGAQTRDFTYVSDMARGILLAGESDACIGETINLGAGEEITINELAQAVADAVGRDDSPIEHQPMRPGDTLRLCADIGRAREVLGFEVQVSLREGLGKLLEWYAAQGRSPKELLKDEVVQNWAAADGEATSG